MHQKVPHGNHIGPRNFGMRDAQRLTYRTRRLADDLKVMHHPHLQHLVAIEPLPSTADPFLNPLDRVQDVLETAGVVPHRTTASSSTLCRIRCFRPLWLATSTLEPSRFCNSSTRAAWLSNPRPGSNSTNRSTSLSGVSSPRTTEPKTRTFRAPCRAAMARICSRFDLRLS